MWVLVPYLKDGFYVSSHSLLRTMIVLGCLRDKKFKTLYFDSLPNCVVWHLRKLSARWFRCKKKRFLPGVVHLNLIQVAKPIWMFTTSLGGGPAKFIFIFIKSQLVNILALWSHIAM